MQYTSCLSNKLDRWHMHVNVFFFTFSLLIRAWNLFTSLTWTQPCSKHLLHVTPRNLRKMEIRLSKILYTNPFIIPQIICSQGNLPFDKLCKHMHMDACIGRHLNETVLWGTITWSSQNIQAEKVFCPISGPHSPRWSYSTHLWSFILYFSFCFVWIQVFHP